MTVPCLVLGFQSSRSKRLKHSSAFLHQTSRKSFKNKPPHTSNSLPDSRPFLEWPHPGQLQKNLNATTLFAGSAQSAGGVASTRLWGAGISERALSYSSSVGSAAALGPPWQGGISEAPIRPFLNAFLLMRLGRRNRRHCSERCPFVAFSLATRRYQSPPPDRKS